MRVSYDNLWDEEIDKIKKELATGPTPDKVIHLQHLLNKFQSKKAHEEFKKYVDLGMMPINNNGPYFGGAGVISYTCEACDGVYNVKPGKSGLCPNCISALGMLSRRTNSWMFKNNKDEGT